MSAQHAHAHTCTYTSSRSRSPIEKDFALSRDPALNLSRGSSWFVMSLSLSPLALSLSSLSSLLSHRVRSMRSCVYSRIWFESHAGVSCTHISIHTRRGIYTPFSLYCFQCALYAPAHTHTHTHWHPLFSLRYLLYFSARSLVFADRTRFECRIKLNVTYPRGVDFSGRNVSLETLLTQQVSDMHALCMIIAWFFFFTCYTYLFFAPLHPRGTR